MSGRKIMIFAGTTEGRMLAEKLSGLGYPCVVSVATDYGASLMKPDKNIVIAEGRKSRPAMAELIRECSAFIVVDATHPFAVRASEEIRGAAADAGAEYIRLARDTEGDFLQKTDASGGDAGDFLQKTDASGGDAGELSQKADAPAAHKNGLVQTVRRLPENVNDAAKKAYLPAANAKDLCMVDSPEEATAVLNEIQGNIFISTGSREIGKIAKAVNNPGRLYARVLPTAESLAKCAEAGIKGAHVIAMQGPFSEELNMAMFLQTDAKAVLMKESGRVGGEDTKIRAARKLGLKIVVIRNPESRGTGSGEKHFGFDAALQYVLRAAEKAGICESAENTGFVSESGEAETDSAAAQTVKAAVIASGVSGNKAFSAASRSGSSDSEERTKKGDRHLTVAGIGDGIANVTPACIEAVRGADVIFGSARMLDFARRTLDIYDGQTADKTGKNGTFADTLKISDAVPAAARNTSQEVSGSAMRGRAPASLPYFADMYQGSRIRDYLAMHPEYHRPVVLLSGDTGFFSGAAGILKCFEGDANWKVTVLPGMSSAALLAARLHISWQDARMLSVHGRKMEDVNPAGWVMSNRKIFILVSGAEDVRALGRIFRQTDDAAGACEPDRGLPAMPQLRFAYGTNLGMEDESYGWLTAEELCAFDTKGLTILYIENNDAGRRILTPGIRDSAFARSAENAARQVPMTKEEIRVLSLARLRLTPEAVLWDIGAGCGSVSVEAARLAPGIRVYAVEMKADAAAVIRANCERFGVKNVKIVPARAPEGLEALPVPSHVFIGGSSGSIDAILTGALAKNPRVRIVINTVTLETQTEALAALHRLPVSEPSVRTVSCARAEKAGHFHLMKAINPVTIIDCEGRPELNENPADRS